MRVLVTGATGFVGANVVRHLLARGDVPVCVTRATSPPLALEGLAIETVQAGLSDVEALKRAMDGCEGVYHVAGIFDPGPDGAHAMHACHVDGTDNIFRAAQATGARRVIVCSSSITVGFGPREAPGDEETPIDPDRIYGRTGALRAYYASKLRSEELSREWTARGVEGVVVNPDFVLGAWDVKPTSGQLIVTMAARWVPVYPRGGKCFVDADDVAIAHLLAMDRGTPGRRYLLGTENHSYREFMEMVAEVVGRRPPVAPLPRTATRALGLVGTLLARWDPHRAAGLEPHVLSSMQQPRYRSGRRALEELGMPHTPVRESIEKAWRWFLDHGYVRA